MVQPRRIARDLNQEVESGPDDGVTQVTQIIPLGMKFCTCHLSAPYAFANARGLNVALEDEGTAEFREETALVFCGEV
jgi:hypothetical protein